MPLNFYSMKKILFAATAAMILIACSDDTSTPVQPETPAADSTVTAAVSDPDVPQDHYQPEGLDKTSIIRKSREYKIKNMSAADLSELFGITIMGDENDIFNGTYGNGLSKGGEQPHGAFTFGTTAPDSKSGTWHLIRYDGEMSYGKPAGEWKVGYMNYKNGKTQQNLIITIPFRNEICGQVRVKGQIHATIDLSDQLVDTEGACTAEAALEMALAEAQRKVAITEEKKAKKAAK